MPGPAAIVVNDAEVTVVTNARKETEPLTDVHQVPKMEATKPELLDPDPHPWNLEEDLAVAKPNRRSIVSSVFLRCSTDKNCQ